MTIARSDDDWSEQVVMVPTGAHAMLGIVTAPARRHCRRALLIVPGGPQNRCGSARRFVDLARRAAARGILSLRIDLPGMGDSAGPLPNFEQATPGIRAAIAHLLAIDPAIESIVVWGLCDGGTAGLLAARDCPGVHGVVIVNGWARTPAGAAGALLQTHYRRRLGSPAFWRRVLRGEVDLVRGGIDLLRTIGAGSRVSSLAGRAMRMPVRQGVAWPTGTGGTAATDVAPVGSHRAGKRAPASLPDRIVRALHAQRVSTLVVTALADPTGLEFRALVARALGRGRHLPSPRVQLFDLPDGDHAITDPADWEQVVDTSLAFIVASLGYGPRSCAPPTSSSCAQSMV